MVGWMMGWVDGWMDGGVDGWVDGLMERCMHGWMHACMDGWMDYWCWLNDYVKAVGEGCASCCLSNRSDWNTDECQQSALIQPPILTVPPHDILPPTPTMVSTLIQPPILTVPPTNHTLIHCFVMRPSSLFLWRHRHPGLHSSFRPFDPWTFADLFIDPVGRWGAARWSSSFHCNERITTFILGWVGEWVSNCVNVRWRYFQMMGQGT